MQAEILSSKVIAEILVLIAAQAEYSVLFLQKPVPLDYYSKKE